MNEEMNDELIGREVDSPMGRGVIVYADDKSVDVDFSNCTWSGPRSALGVGNEPKLIEKASRD